MPEPLDATLELDISEALSRIDEVRAATEESLAGAGEALAESLAEAVGGVPPVELEADASAVGPEVESALGDAETTVPVDADTTEAEADLAGLEAEPVDVPVDVETDAAASEIAGLADAAPDGISVPVEVEGAEEAASALGEVGAAGEEAAGGLDSATSASAATGGAAAIATGDMAGLEGAVGGVTAKAGPYGAAIGAAAVATGGLFTAGLDAEGATARFDATLGNLSERVQNIQVGNLNADLTTLALSLGSDDEAALQAVSSIFQFAEASGAGREEAANFSQEAFVLAARAVALKPSLGDVGEVAERMTGPLSRGGRFAAGLGISLTSAEINARALADTGKETAAELTIYEKAAAGAAIATERYGGSLQQQIATGTENPIIQQRRLTEELKNFVEEAGRPLVVPVLDALAEAGPIAGIVAQNLSTLAQVALPLVSAALEAVTVPLGVVSVLFGALQPVLQPVTELLARLVTFSILETIFRAIAGGLEELEPIADALGTAVGALGDFFGGLVEKLGPVGDLIGTVVDAFGAVVDASGLFSGGLDEASAALEDRLLAAARNSPAALEALIQSLGLSTDKERELRAAVEEELAAEGKRKGATDESKTAMEQAAEAADTYKTKLDALLGVHLSATQAEIDFAQNLAETNASLFENAGSLDRNTEAGRLSTEAVLGNIDAARAHSEAVLAETNSTDLANQALAGHRQALVDTLAPYLGSADAASAFLTQLGFTPEIAAGASGAVEGFNFTLGTLPGAAQAAAGGFFAQFSQIPGFTEATVNGAGTAIQTSSPFLVQAALDAGGQAFVNFGTGLLPIPNAAAQSMIDAGFQITVGAPTGEAAAAADRMAGGWKAGADAVGPHTQAAMDRARTVIRNLDDLGGFSKGDAAGKSFGDGIAGGINSRTPQIENAAREAVRKAWTAAANAGSPSEHLFRDLGADLSAALEAGITDGEAAVVAAAAGVIAAAAVPLESELGLAVQSARGSGFGGFGGGMVLQIDDVTVQILGPVGSPEQARDAAFAAGEGLSAGIASGLDKREAEFAARVRS